MATDAQERQLKHIEAISQNARTSWFALLALLVFVGVTLMGHKDADLFAFGAATTLPIANIDVPPKVFFVGASILTAALYAYLHLYLLNLWDALAEIDPTVSGEGCPPKPISTRIHPTMMALAALRRRDRARKDEAACAHPQPLGWVVDLICFTMVWLFGMVILGLLWWRSMPAHNVWLTLLIGMCFWGASMLALRSGGFFMARLTGHTREQANQSGRADRILLAITLTCVVAISYVRTDGLIDDRFIARANLREAELTVKPADWLDHGEWVKEYEETYRRREGYPKPMDLPLGKQAELGEELTTRWKTRTGALQKVSLEGRDLRGADMTRTFLAGADLRAAQMHGTLLWAAQIQGADLSEAQMQGAYLWEAQMQGADLIGAQMQEADLGRAQMQGANLRAAQMHGTVLSGAQMQGAVLIGAQMQGAILGGARMQGADLSGAQMQGAYLRWADMQGADLRWVDMQGADLRWAVLRPAHCGSVSATATDLKSAEYTCETLKQADLTGFVGDARTLLPDGLTVASCVPADAPGVAEALEQVPEDQREENRESLLCKPGQTPHATGVWAFEKRFDPEWFQGAARKAGIGIRKAE